MNVQAPRIGPQPWDQVRTRLDQALPLARQIADALFISAKTASVHVSNILAKLGLANRTEIAAWAVRSGLAG